MSAIRKQSGTSADNNVNPLVSLRWRCNVLTLSKNMQWIASGLPVTRAQFRRTEGSRPKRSITLICIPLAHWCIGGGSVFQPIINLLISMNVEHRETPTNRARCLENAADGSSPAIDNWPHKQKSRSLRSGLYSVFQLICRLHRCKPSQPAASDSLQAPFLWSGVLTFFPSGTPASRSGSCSSEHHND